MQGKGDGAIAPPLGSFGKKNIKKKINKIENVKGSFENEVDEIRVLFKNRCRLVSETCNFCRILLHVDDQSLNLFLGPLRLKSVSHFKNLCDFEKAL